MPIDLIAPVIPLSIRPGAYGRYTVTVAGVQVEVTDQVPFATVTGVVVPLALAPFVRDGRLHLPLQLIGDVVPRYSAARLRYTAAARELRLLRPGRGRIADRDTSTVTRRRSSAASRAAASARRRHVVVVDAGHGGPDRGMSGPIGARNKVYEKDVTLAVARKLQNTLRARGAEVVMTRTTDTLIALADRGRIANRSHGDVFISVHVNAANMRWARPGDARGVETYFLAEAKTEDMKRVEQMENEAVRFETGASVTKDDALGLIIKDMEQNQYLRESSELADLVQQRLAAIHPGRDRGVKQAGFRVLVTAFMPAVLVEIGFGTNATEARYLTDPGRQREIADAIADATLQYLDRYQQRLGSAGR
ncbi:MAG: N-acetylmuramoyl-L-alanine amidase [Chloroflexota bacterium]|nr:N-acetylmuramoyl-L-alanine amidase [Chloroflexota bacterium]